MWVSILGYVIDASTNPMVGWFKYHPGRDITTRNLMHFHDIPLDKNDDRQVFLENRFCITLLQTFQLQPLLFAEVHLSATGKWNILGKLLPHVLTKWGNLSLKQLLKSNELSWLFLEQIILFWKLQRNRCETIDVLNDHWLAIKVPPDSVDFDLLETRRYFSVGPKIQNKKEICKTCFFENGKKK